jgi:DNA polymerase I-like protein with 3'-5' exonuclease and polymerase domains
MIVDIENTHIWKNKIEEYIYNNIPENRDTQLDMFDQSKRIIISVSSPLQMIKVFQKFGIPTKDKYGKDSINEKIISKSPHEFVQMWLNFQEANHRITTFGDTIYQQIENNRIYTNFNPMVNTSRLSTRKGNINFLNFPADKLTRNCFKANEGNVMVVCDWQGQENSIAADLSGDEAMTNSVVNGADLHCAFARVLFPELKDLSDEEIMAKHKDKRQSAKAPRFAFAYGGSAFTIHQSMGISMEKATKIENSFKELHAGLFTWGDKIYLESIKKGYIESVDGWKLKLPDFERFTILKDKIADISRMQWQMYRQGKIEYKAKQADDKYEYKIKANVDVYREKKKDVSAYFKLKSEYQRLCLNSPVQTCGAMMLKRATSSFFEWIIENNYIGKVLIDNTIHDEIVIECPKELGELVRTTLQKCMIEDGNHYLKNLTIKADAHYANSWGEAK